MKKLVNDVHAVVRETLEGFALAHPDPSMSTTRRIS